MNDSLREDVRELWENITEVYTMTVDAYMLDVFQKLPDMTIQVYSSGCFICCLLNALWRFEISLSHTSILHRDITRVCMFGQTGQSTQTRPMKTA